MKGIHVSCLVTGEKKYLSGNSLQNKLSKYGSPEGVQKYYISQPVKKMLKQGLSVQDIRTKLNSQITSTVDIEILYKLKLLKMSKKRKKLLTPQEQKLQEQQTQENERKYYEHKEKMTTCLKTWVEWATGGPNKCQVPNGGTCIRPDIYYDNEGDRTGRCRPCPYHEHCLCSGKELK